MTNSECGAFRFHEGNCKSLKSRDIYIKHDEASPIDVYMLDSDAGKLLCNSIRTL